jgi:CubicO group peptidase (beta-lactamase class C family)
MDMIDMKKILSIIIIGILIGCSFGVQGVFLKQRTTEATETATANLGDFLFDKKMEVLMKLSKFPSLSACIIEGDEVTWSNGYGFYDLENKKPATENTVYNIASIAKTITGTALMQLWEQGLFDLDEDVNNYLPFSLRNPHFPDNPINFRMLLSHSSSLNYDTMEYYWFNFSGDPPFPFYPYTWLEEFLMPGGRWYHSEIWSNVYRPGEYNMYANVGFEIIGYLIELISGEEFLHYCKEHIFNPLEMYSTGWNLSELTIDNVAIPYHYHNSEYLQINELSYLLGRHTPPDKYWRFRMYPAGGLYTTVSDFSHFLIAHMNSGMWNGIRILEENTVEKMHTIHGNMDPIGNYYYGLGWGFQKYPIIFNLTVSGHGGGVWGVTTAMYCIPNENVGHILFTNGDGLYEQNVVVSAIANSLIPLLLFNKGGVDLRSYIDFGNCRG